MKLKSLGTITLVLATLLLAGCRSAPVYNVSDAHYTTTEQGVTEADIAAAILTAGRSLGWIMKEQGPGHILGTLHLRTHTAVVDINYDRTKYSITYNSSVDLDYDGTNIHSNYNGWIQNLSNAIDVQVSNL
jgi:long-subunit fatty acid transport protein